MIRKKLIDIKIEKIINKLVILSLLILIFRPINIVVAIKEEEYKPISVTGFNEDVVAEYLAPFVEAMTSTSIAMDNSNNVFYTHTISVFNRFSQPGLPDDRTINSEATDGVKYELQQYKKNNVLLLSSSTSTGTLTFSQNSDSSEKYEKLYLLTTSTSGNCYIDITIKFKDGSSTTYSQVEIQDWYNGDNYAVRNVGRINRITGRDTGDPLDSKGNKGNPRMYETVLELKKEDQRKVIDSIYFDSNINDKKKISIFAISGKVADKKPDIPLLTEVTNILSNSATLNWNAAYNATSYSVDVATDINFSNESILKDYNNKTVNEQSLQLAGLNNNTTYYFRVRGENEYGQSENSEIGVFKTNSLYKITILKHPDSLIVEENNINDTLSVNAVTNSQKELIYTWYLCRDELGSDVIQKEISGSTYVIPTDLLQGNYYVYCEIHNEDTETVKTEIAMISVEVIYNVDLSWGEMKFEFGQGKEWNPKTHTYVGEDTYRWRLKSVDGENNKITISNHSSRPLSTSIEYLSKEGAFNQIFNDNTSVQGRFYKSNEDAIKASGYLDNLTENLTFGKRVVEETIETDRWIKYQNSNKFETYFAFSGMPDLDKNENNEIKLDEYQTVGSIKIKLQIEN